MEAKLEYMKWQRNKFLSKEELMELKTYRENDELLEELFGRNVDFDEDGMKGKYGIGMSRVNRYQVARSVQAYSNNLIRKAGGRVGKGVAVGFDTGAEGERYGETVARMLLGNGIGTALFIGAKSAAQLSFAIRYLDLEGGVMITAESDPADYCGLRFFNNKGSEMSAEDMEDIVEEFEHIMQFNEVHEYIGYLRLNSIHHKIGLANDFKYMAEVLKKAVVNDDCDKEMPAVYTALCGSGFVYFPEIFKERGFKKAYVVKEQTNKDVALASIAKPDPADAESYAEAIKLAEEKNAEIIVATNADCGKAGAMIKNADGKYELLSSDQIAELLLDYIANYKNDMPAGAFAVLPEGNGSKCKAIAEKAGIAVKETADGFKYVGEAIEESRDKDNSNFVFAYDGDNGYLTGTYVNEKDGTAACMILVEMAATYAKEGISVSEKLAQL